MQRLRAAEAHRRKVVRDSDAYRVVHGEADLLPALIVDRYGDYLVMPMYESAHKRELLSIYSKLLADRYGEQFESFWSKAIKPKKKQSK